MPSSRRAAPGLRMITGKVLQDRNSPDGVRDETEQSLVDTEDADPQVAQRRPPGLRHHAALCAQQHRRAAARRRRAGREVRRHLDPVARGGEQGRVEVGARAVPESRSYLDVYAGFGLMRERAVYAHCIYFDDDDRRLMRARKPPPPSAPPATCSWAAASSTSARPTASESPSGWPAMWAAAPASARSTPCWRRTTWAVKGRPRPA
jgi:guanine deaminase